MKYTTVRSALPRRRVLFTYKQSMRCKAKINTARMNEPHPRRINLSIGLEATARQPAKHTTPASSEGRTHNGKLQTRCANCNRDLESARKEVCAQTMLPIDNVKKRHAHTSVKRWRNTTLHKKIRKRKQTTICAPQPKFTSALKLNATNVDTRVCRRCARRTASRGQSSCARRREESARANAQRICLL